MAFYKDMKHKTRQEKRVEAAARGGFEDEGAGYRKGGAQKGRAARSAEGHGGVREQAGRAQEPRRAQGRTGADLSLIHISKRAGAWVKAWRPPACLRSVKHALSFPGPATGRGFLGCA